MGVGQFDVADGAGGLLDLAGDAGVALAAQSDRPVDGGVLADLRLPVGAHAREEVGEDEARAAAIRTVDDDDVDRGKLDSGVLAGDRGVIPLGDLAEEDVGDGRAIELERGAAGQVVADDDRTGDRRDVQEGPGGLGQVLVGHRAVGGAEVHGLRQDLLLTATGANALVVEGHGRIDLLVLVKPLLVDGLGKGGTCAVDEHLAGRAGGSEDGEDKGQSEFFHYEEVW